MEITITKTTLDAIAEMLKATCKEFISKDNVSIWENDAFTLIHDHENEAIVLYFDDEKNDDAVFEFVNGEWFLSEDNLGTPIK